MEKEKTPFIQLCEYLVDNDGYEKLLKPVRISIYDVDNDRTRNLSIHAVVIKLETIYEMTGGKCETSVGVYMIDSNFECWCVEDYCSDEQMEILRNACYEKACCAKISKQELN